MECLFFHGIFHGIFTDMYMTKIEDIMDYRDTSPAIAGI